MVEEKTEKKNFLVAHDSSAKFASIFFLFLLSLRVTTRIARSSCPIFFYSSSFLPSIFRFQRLFPSLSHSLTLHKGGHGNAGKIDSNISEIVIRSRSSHCSEIDGRVYVFAWVEGRERIHRE